MILDLVRLLYIPFLAESEKRGAIATEFWGDPFGGHGLDEVEGEVGVAARGREADEGGVGGLVGGDVVDGHVVEDVEGAGGVQGGCGGMGAEVEEDVVVVEGERGGFGEGGIVEIEGFRDVALLRADVEVAAEEVFRHLATGFFGWFGGGGGGGLGCEGEVFDEMSERRDGDFRVWGMGKEGGGGTEEDYGGAEGNGRRHLISLVISSR